MKRSHIHSSQDQAPRDATTILKPIAHPRLRRSAIVATLLVLSSPLAAVDLPRGTLWRVVQTCVLNQRTTGSPFPCLQVDQAGGYAVLRAPFRQTHIVTMPTIRITGIEDPALRKPGARHYFGDAWAARHFVQQELKRPMADDDIGLAVNSIYTRSQDQLHIHVDCVDQRAKRALAARLATIPRDSWQPNGFAYDGQAYWARRLAGTDLDAVDVVSLIDEIPAIRAYPRRTVLAVVGVKDDGGNGFVLLAGQSNPLRGDSQPTSEDLLDHQCRRAAASGAGGGSVGAPDAKVDDIEKGRLPG